MRSAERLARSRRAQNEGAAKQTVQKTAAVAALVEVGDRAGFGSAVPVGAKRATRSLERLRESADGDRDGRAANTDWLGVGRCRIRQPSGIIPTSASTSERKA